MPYSTSSTGASLHQQLVRYSTKITASPRYHRQFNAEDQDLHPKYYLDNLNCDAVSENKCSQIDLLDG